MPASRNVLVSIVFRVLVCTALLLIAGGIFWYLAKTRPQPAISENLNAAPRVLVMQARAVPVQREWQGFGTAAAMDAANVPARVTATVVERPENIREGQPVAQGQLLVRLDESDFARQVEITSQAIADIDAQLAQLNVEQSSASQRAELAAEDVRLARADYARIQQAVQNQAANQRELDEAQQRLNAAQESEVAARNALSQIAPRRLSLQAQRQSQEAALQLATQSVERSRILSPIDGVLQSVDVDVGESITAGQRVARVVNLQRIEVPLLLPATARAYVNVGDAAILTSAGEQSQSMRWNGTVARIAPEDDIATRTMRVFVELKQQPGKETLLPPGKFVQGFVVSGQPQNRWVVPRRALEGERVMLIENGIVTSRAVQVDFQFQAELPELGLPDTQWAVLMQPLDVNALVVVDGSRVLNEGGAATPVLASELESGNLPASANQMNNADSSSAISQDNNP